MDLLELRNKMNLTQKKCSEILGISLKTYANYENKSGNYDLNKYLSFCKKLEEYQTSIQDDFRCIVKVKDELKTFVSLVSHYEKRTCYQQIEEYLRSPDFSKVLILYGLRRTGKTTLIKQSILSMKKKDFDRAAFIQITSNDTLASLNHDLKILMEREYKYIFIDEATYMSDFIEGASLLSDIFVANGMKIVLSGMDSLGFWITKSNELFDRAILIHTTFISYYEFENVLKINGIDNYITYGGTMSLSGNYYNDNLFINEARTDEYVDSAISQNIQHSLKWYQDEGHFRNLEELYRKDELTNAINRVVESINHEFTLDVLTKDFISHDLGLSQRNLRKDRLQKNDTLDQVDKEEITGKLKEALKILNKDEQRVEIQKVHQDEIKEYLYALDLIENIDKETIPPSSEKKSLVVLSQPGLRYSQVKILVEKLLEDPLFATHSIEERNMIIKRILDEVKGRMMEEIILLETKIAKPQKSVCKLFFAFGEFDMVVYDKEQATCEIYEIKHSQEVISNQQRFITNQDLCEKTEFRFGKIISKNVIYRGADQKLDNGVNYLNVENYLKNLYKQ